MIIKLFLSFLKIGFFAFGGGYASISLITDEIVTKQHWLSINEFLEVISISQLTPGPIAINAATYIGYKLGGFTGAVVSTFAIIMPPILMITFYFGVLMVIDKFLKNKISFKFDLVFILQKVVVILIIIAGLRIFKRIILTEFDLQDIFIFIISIFLLNIHLIFKKVSVVKIYWVIILSGCISIILSLF